MTRRRKTAVSGIPWMGGTVCVVPTDRIDVESAYQRPLNPGRVRKITKEFAPQLFGALSLQLKPDGRYDVIDGQHRKAAALILEGVESVPAVVFEPETAFRKKEAAGFFRKMNTNRWNVNGIEDFTAALTEGSKYAREVNKAVIRQGYELVKSTGRKPRKIACVRALMRWAHRMEDGFHDVWDLCAKAHHDEAIDDRILTAVFTIEEKLVNGQYSSPKRDEVSLLDPENQDKLMTFSKDALIASINGVQTAMAGSWSSNKVRSTGVLNCVNKGRRKNNRIELTW